MPTARDHSCQKLQFSGWKDWDSDSESTCEAEHGDEGAAERAKVDGVVAKSVDTHNQLCASGVSALSEIGYTHRCNGLSLALAKCHPAAVRVLPFWFSARGMSCAAVRVLVKAKQRPTKG